MGLEQYQSIITKYNVDDNNNPIAVRGVGNQKVHPTKYMIQTGVLDEFYRFTIINLSMNEVYNVGDIRDSSDYYVDYNNGKIYFHEDMAGKTIQYVCAELGVDLINACRVVTDFDERGNVKETLDDLIEKVNNAVVTTGIFKENKEFNIPSESLVYNIETELYEYQLNHKLTSNNLIWKVYNGAEEVFDVCRRLDEDNIIVANDDKIDLKIVINYGSVS